jgi:mitochondrial fission protein ELM1
VVPAFAVSQITIGTLTCDASAGFDAAKEISLLCEFRPPDGPSEAYAANVQQYNPNAGAAGHLVWTVTARKVPDQSGSLAGDYARTPISVLVGGRNRAFTLQPDVGDDIAQAASRMTLVASN